MRSAENHAHIVGVGNTIYCRTSDRTAEVLAIEATMAAARDAGISPQAIDGIISYPGHVGADVILTNLDLPRVRFRVTIDLGGAAAVSGLRAAALAVLSGSANNVLLLRAAKNSSSGKKWDRPSFLPSQGLRRHLEHPYGCNVPAQRYAFLAQRYRTEHGLDRRVLGEIALAARAHAQIAPGAQMGGRPMTMDDYLSSRLIADPYHLLDCCLDTDGACAVIVSAKAAADQDRRRGVRIIAVAESPGVSFHDFSNREPFLDIGLTDAAQDVWEGSGLGPQDMDAAMIYDCFTFEVLHQLEEAGFAEVGQGAALVADGGIRLGGKLPVNTHGGLLSHGHLQGLSHIVEAVHQLRGEAGRRQIEGARLIAVSGWGNLGDGSFAVLGGADA